MIPCNNSTIFRTFDPSPPLRKKPSQLSTIVLTAHSTGGGQYLHPGESVFTTRRCGGTPYLRRWTHENKFTFPTTSLLRMQSPNDLLETDKQSAFTRPHCPNVAYTGKSQRGKLSNKKVTSALRGRNIRTYWARFLWGSILMIANMSIRSNTLGYHWQPSVNQFAKPPGNTTAPNKSARPPSSENFRAQPS